MWKLAFDELFVYLMVFARMSGMILFNPVLSRRNIPAQFKMGLILGLTLALAPNIDGSYLEGMNDIELYARLLLELGIGYVCGFIIQAFYYLILTAGDIMDMQFGLSMARVFDPGSNIQMSVSGNFLSLLFYLYFFTTNSHLQMIRIFAASYRLVPAGGAAFTPEVAQFALTLFSAAFSMIIKLMLPFVVAELTVEISMGVLMKLIPQIHVFVINIQFKLLIAIFLLFAYASPITAFVDNYMRIMMDNLMQLFPVLAG